MSKRVDEATIQAILNNRDAIDRGEWGGNAIRFEHEQMWELYPAILRDYLTLRQVVRDVADGPFRYDDYRIGECPYCKETVVGTDCYLPTEHHPSCAYRRAVEWEHGTAANESANERLAEPHPDESL